MKKQRNCRSLLCSLPHERCSLFPSFYTKQNPSEKGPPKQSVQSILTTANASSPIPRELSRPAVQHHLTATTRRVLSGEALNDTKGFGILTLGTEVRSATEPITAVHSKMDQPHVTFSNRPLAPRPPPPPPDQQPMSINPKKQRRITKACDYCSRRSIRCPPREGDTRCQNCVDFALDCTYDRPSKKRGIQSGSTNSPGKHGAPGRSHNGETGGSILFGMMNNDMSSASAFDVQSRIPEKWMSMVLGIEQKIQPLVEIYFEVVYPM